MKGWDSVCIVRRVRVVCVLGVFGGRGSRLSVCWEGLMVCMLGVRRSEGRVCFGRIKSRAREGVSVCVLVGAVT